MAHTCPECGMLCYCGGDIDDCEMDGTEEQNKCSHCEDEDKVCTDDPTSEEADREFRESMRLQSHSGSAAPSENPVPDVEKPKKDNPMD